VTEEIIGRNTFLSHILLGGVHTTFISLYVYFIALSVTQNAQRAMNGYRIINWKGCGRKWTWLYSVTPGNLLEEGCENIKHLGQANRCSCPGLNLVSPD
jgi:hypothetical protein